jgi:hypothetical protein
MAEDKKIYAGSGRKVNPYIRGISVCLDDIQQYAVRSEKNGKFYVKLNVVDLKQSNQWGKDVSVEIDTWKPDSTRKSTTGVPQKYHGSQKQNTPENFVDDSGDLAIPF